MISEPSRVTQGFPSGSVVKNPPPKAEDIHLIPWGWQGLGVEIPWRRKGQPTSVFLPSEIPGAVEPGRLQSVGSQESDMTYRLNNNDDNKN